MATLTKAMLDDLHKGCASIKLITPIAMGSGDVSFDWTSVDFSAADELFTVKDTFKVAQSEASTTEIKIDQGDKTIDTDDEKGEFTIAGDIPSVAKAVLDYFFAHSVDTTQRSIKVNSSVAADYNGYGYSTEVKKTKATVCVTSESKKTAVFFTNVSFTAIYTDEDMKTPAVVRFKGTVLASTVTGVDDMYILKKIS